MFFYLGVKLFTAIVRLEVIIDYGSAFVTYGNEIESKETSFPAEMPLTKLAEAVI